MSMYRVKSGLHFVNGKLLRVGETFSLKSDKFVDAENAKLFEKIEEPKAQKKAKEPEDPIGPVGEAGETGPVGPDDSGAAGASGPADDANAPKKRGPKPKNPTE